MPNKLKRGDDVEKQESAELATGALSHLSVELGTINDEWKLGMGVEYKGEKYIVTDIDEGWDFRCPKKTPAWQCQ